MTISLTTEEATQIRDLLADAINRGRDRSRQPTNTPKYPYLMFCSILPIPA